MYFVFEFGYWLPPPQHVYQVFGIALEGIVGWSYDVMDKCPFFQHS